MFRSTLLLGSVIVAIALGACTAKTSDKPAAKKPATGTAATTTTKKPPSTPPPQQKVSSTVGANQSSATQTEAACTAADEGKGVCVDEFVVFCAGGTLWALDCAAAFGGTCGAVGEGIDCVVEE